jgi:hypothetical protein
MRVALANTTFVADVPPNFTVAPVLKPVPLIVNGSPPFTEPNDGLTAVTVTGDTATVTFAELVDEQPFAVTVICSVNVPTAPAVKVIEFVPLPEVMVPLVIDQLYVAPAPALATLAALPVLPLLTVDGAVIAALGLALTVTVVAADAALLQPFDVTTTV